MNGVVFFRILINANDSKGCYKVLNTIMNTNKTSFLLLLLCQVMLSGSFIRANLI